LGAAVFRKRRVQLRQRVDVGRNPSPATISPPPQSAHVCPDPPYQCFAALKQRRPKCLAKGMGSINNLTSTYLQSAFSTALQGAALTAETSASGVSNLSDEGQLSPVAQAIGTLQQLQQSNPGEYQQVIQQIAANLQSAAQTAQSDGDTAAAGQLSQLAADFSNASSSGQLPSLQQLAEAVGGHHHHHHSPAAAADSASNGTQSSSLNPLAIIENTLSASSSA
jgi:hypothetical protein